MELVSHHLCPYVQRAAIALAEKGVDFHRINIDLAAKPGWFSAISPLGKVPLLRLDNGEVLFESAAICDYLDETIAPRLHPHDPVARARHRGWIEVASAILQDIGGLYSAPSAAGFEGKCLDLTVKFGRLEATLGDGPYFAGAGFSLVDAAFAPAFRYFDVFDRFVATAIFAQAPKVRAWRRALAERPSVAGAAPADYGRRLEVFLRARGSHMSGLMTASA